MTSNPRTQHVEPASGPAQAGDSPATGSLDLTVLAPAHNEEDNVRPLVEEIDAALQGSGLSYEILIVDDGSVDATRARIQDMMRSCPRLRCIGMTHTPPGKGNGQSAAFHAGIRAAKGRLIATLDADLQNDPKDLPAMIEALHQEEADLVQGDRSHARRDNVVRRVGSIVGRTFRRWLLGDSVRDTGCSLRVMKREFAMRLPLEFRGMHRFIPVSIRDLGGVVIERRVNHRPRTAGQTKYGMGIVQRAIPGLVDLFAVRYMRKRRRPISSVEVARHGAPIDGHSATRRSQGTEARA
jgi:glycosyltransferase involved in cell wall biosynthesis